jgi:hypothetical protein
LNTLIPQIERWQVLDIQHFLVRWESDQELIRSQVPHLSRPLLTKNFRRLFF